ncbi:hypothetical protein JB92DRAFT_2832462 [Gautieria morchelliformis]|nr:hypothetical protein JB92DRAFT_2832462 [Gautieria morchelliformis]
MPRRSTRATVLSQDDIEVDEQENIPSQHDSVQDADQPMDSADEALPEQKPGRRTRKSNTTKSKTVKIKTEQKKIFRAPENAPDDGHSDDSEAVAPFDRDEFLATARPIPPEGAKTIDGVISDLQTVVHALGHQGFNLVLETAVAVEETSGNTEEGQEAATKLDLVMRQLADAQQELKIHQGTLDALKQSILRDEAQGNIVETYTQNVADALQAYNNSTTRQKYAKHVDYFKFRDRVWEVNHEDAMPPLGDLLPREDGDSDVESDIEVGGMTQDYKCPLTLMPLTDPLTSKTCRHSFSAAPIREYIATGGGRMKCPATGCNQNLTLNDLEADDDLARRATIALRRAQRREDSDKSDAEVVD